MLVFWNLICVLVLIKVIQQIERGFQTINKTSLKTFRINFFFILIIFIVFDLELILIFSFGEKINNIFIFFTGLFLFLTLILE